MPFVKWDTKVLTSSLWAKKDQCRIFNTALLLAMPEEFSYGVAQLEPDSPSETGWMLPPGWYGLVEMSSPVLVEKAVLDIIPGIEALRALGDPDIYSRDSDYEGRRMVRIQNGFVILNYCKYRDWDHTSAERSKRYRARQAEKRLKDRAKDPCPEDGCGATTTCDAVTDTRDITHADAPAPAHASANKNQPTLPIDQVGGGQEGETGKVGALSPARQSLFDLFVGRGVRQSLALEGATGPKLSEGDVEEISRQFRRHLDSVKKSGAKSQSAVLARRCQTGQVLDDLDHFRVVDGNIRLLRPQEPTKAPLGTLKPSSQPGHSKDDSRFLAPLLETFCQESGLEEAPHWWPWLRVVEGGVVCPAGMWLEESLRVAAEACDLRIAFTNENLAGQGNQ